MSLVELWIKAAVEHKTVQIIYKDSEGVVTTREVEPDFYGWSKNKRNFGLWGHCRLRNQNRCFKEENVINWKYIGDSFSPNPYGRWNELTNEYNKRSLQTKDYSTF